MTLEQYNRARETQLYRHELELEMQRRRRYLDLCKMMEEYNQIYHSRQTKPYNKERINTSFHTRAIDKMDKTAEINHLPSSFDEWLHEKTYSEENYIR